MNKKVYFITQAKGGSGKSVLTFMLSEKYKEALVLDLDDATTTTMKQLAYRKPVKVSFLDPNTKRIDRGAFNGLFESIIEAKREFFIADLGASVAEQLPKYLLMNGAELVAELLQSHDIQLQIVCIVGGGNIFKATMEHLVELTEATAGKFQIVVAHNGFYPCADEQKKQLNDFVKANSLSLIEFDLVKDKGEMALRTVENVLKDGKGISNLSPFTALYFKKPIEQLSL